MKKYIVDFIRRGFVACGFGPLILVVLYLIFFLRGRLEVLTVDQVCTGILSLWALAFVAGGMNVLYQVERLPLMVAIWTHGGVLYISYLAVYLVNGWLEWGMTAILIFTVIFVFGYLVIWAIIVSIMRRNIEKINEVLKQKQQAQGIPSQQHAKRSV